MPQRWQTLSNVRGSWLVSQAKQWMPRRYFDSRGAFIQP
jgi:hypothetical protein